MHDWMDMTLISEYLAIDETLEGYPVLRIDHPLCVASVALHGAHVMEWTPQGHEPVLYLSSQAVRRPGKAVRGGIPICWPWFNAHPTDAAKPSHGIARTRLWELEEANAGEDGVTLAFGLRSTEDTRQFWPFEFEARVTVRLGRTLEVSLGTLNCGETPFALSEALHTYLRIGDVKRVAVQGLDGAAYLDTVGERVMRQQQGDILFSGEVDRQYEADGVVWVEDPVLGRTLEVEKEGSATTVVWNPWVEKARTLADLPDDGYLNFLCVEAANAGRATLLLPPGESHQIRTKILVKDGGCRA